MISNFTNAPSFLILVKYYIIRVKDTQQPIRVQRQASIRMFNIQEAKGINATLFSGLEQVWCELTFWSTWFSSRISSIIWLLFSIIRQNYFIPILSCYHWKENNVTSVCQLLQVNWFNIIANVPAFDFINYIAFDPILRCLVQGFKVWAGVDLLLCRVRQHWIEHSQKQWDE